jgi:glycosyltransferase involved in cell wall biosynthesis
MAKPDLSIVIPTLNEETNLPWLLDSIMIQTGVSYEIIVADNNSIDSTRRIARSHGARVVAGGLPARARNHGAAAAKSDIILFLDADVILPACDFLEKTLEEFNDRKIDIATCRVIPISEKIIDKLFHRAYNAYLKTVRPVIARAPGFCIFVRRSIHNRIDGFDETVMLAEDHDYARRAAKISKFRILRCYPIIVSVRRFDRDGRLKIAVKYLLCEAYMMIKGPVRSDIFKYRFGHEKVSNSRHS